MCSILRCNVGGLGGIGGCDESNACEEGTANFPMKRIPRVAVNAALFGVVHLLECPPSNACSGWKDDLLRWWLVFVVGPGWSIGWGSAGCGTIGRRWHGDTGGKEAALFFFFGETLHRGNVGGGDVGVPRVVAGDKAFTVRIGVGQCSKPKKRGCLSDGHVAEGKTMLPDARPKQGEIVLSFKFNLGESLKMMKAVLGTGRFHDVKEVVKHFNS